MTDRARASLAGSTGAYAIVLLLVTAFILYGSLFPFEYRPREFPGGPLAYLLTTAHDWDRRGDLLANILLYIPFGFFATYALPPRVPAILRALLALLAGTVLATGIEYIQFHDADRISTLGDVYANAIGTAVGAAGAAIIGASVRWPFIRELAAHPTAALLLVMFFSARLYPYVPTIDLHKYWHAVRFVLAPPVLPPGELTRQVITWLLIAVVVHSLYGFTRFLFLFPLLCVAEFLGHVLVIDGVLKLTDIVGGGAAFLLWALVLRWLPGRFVIVALAFTGLVIALRLQPFTFTATPRAFGWIPFVGFMRGATGVTIQVFCTKFFEYGGMIWLLGRAGMALPIGTALTAALLFATSYAECWLPDRSAEITDATMAASIGLAFALLRHSSRQRRVTADEPPSPADLAAIQAQLADGILARHGVTPTAPRRRGKRYAAYVPPHRRG